MIRRMRRLAAKRLQTVMRLAVVFAFAAQPATLFLLVIPVSAAPLTTNVVINEITPATGTANKWVELYNPTDAPVDISNWRIMRGESLSFGTVIPAGTLVASHGFYVIESTSTSLPLASSAPVELWSGPVSTGTKIDTVTYPTLTAGKSYGRATDGDTAFVTLLTPTKGLSNIATPDTTAPSVPIGGTPHNAFEKTNDFYFTWDAATDDRPGQLTYEFQSSTASTVDANGSLVGAWNSIKNGNAEQKHLDTPKIHSTNAPDGTYYWQVRTIDAANNKSAWSPVWNTTIDTVSPTLRISQPEEDETFGMPNKKRITVQSYLEDSNGLGQYHIDIDGKESTIQNDDDAMRTEGDSMQSASASLTVFALFEASDFSNGRHTINVRVTDKAGNSTTASRTIIIDNPAPEPSAPVVTIDKDVKGRTISGTVSDANATFSVKIDGVLRNDIPVSVGAQTEKGYMWSLKIPNGILSGVEHSIEVMASANGKSAVAESTFILPIDNTVPGSGEGYIPDVGDLLSGQLSESLRQPFVIPATLPPTPSSAKIFASDAADDDVLGAQIAKTPDTDQNAKPIAVAATESGWKLFGFHWYWWVLLAGAGGTAVWLKLRARRSVTEGDFL